MKRRNALAVALAVVAAACSPNGGDDPSSDYSPAGSTDVREVVVVAVPAEPQPGPRDASPQPAAEPVFKPAPEPSPSPAPKPIRSNPPTPPPTRRRPPVAGSDPGVLRVPPALDPRPGGLIDREGSRVAAAIADLAARRELDSNTIQVLDAREVTWRDGSVGCSTPGMAYTDALVPGFLVVLRSGDSSYRYHSAGDLMPFLCETPQAPLEGSA